MNSLTIIILYALFVGAHLQGDYSFLFKYEIFRSIMEDPCFIHRHKSTQKLFQIVVKIGQILLRSCNTNVILIDCEESRHPSCIELSHPQMCMQNIYRTLS